MQNKKRKKYKTPFNLEIYQKWQKKQERIAKEREGWTAIQHIEYKKGLRNIKRERKKYGTSKQWDYVTWLFEKTLDVYKGNCYEDLDKWLIKNKETVCE